MDSPACVQSNRPSGDRPSPTPESRPSGNHKIGGHDNIRPDGNRGQTDCRNPVVNQSSDINDQRNKKGISVDRNDKRKRSEFTKSRKFNFLSRESERQREDISTANNLRRIFACKQPRQSEEKQRPDSPIIGEFNFLPKESKGGEVDYNDNCDLSNLSSDDSKKFPQSIRPSDNSTAHLQHHILSPTSGTSRGCFPQKLRPESKAKFQPRRSVSKSPDYIHRNTRKDSCSKESFKRPSVPKPTSQFRSTSLFPIIPGHLSQYKTSKTSQHTEPAESKQQQCFRTIESHKVDLLQHSKQESRDFFVSQHRDESDSLYERTDIDSDSSGKRSRFDFSRNRVIPSSSRKRTGSFRRESCSLDNRKGSFESSGVSCSYSSSSGSCSSFPSDHLRHPILIKTAESSNDNETNSSVNNISRVNGLSNIYSNNNIHQNKVHKIIGNSIRELKSIHCYANNGQLTKTYAKTVSDNDQITLGNGNRSSINHSSAITNSNLIENNSRTNMETHLVQQTNYSPVDYPEFHSPGDSPKMYQTESSIILRSPESYPLSESDEEAKNVRRFSDNYKESSSSSQVSIWRFSVYCTFFRLTVILFCLCIQL